MVTLAQFVLDSVLIPFFFFFSFKLLFSGISGVSINMGKGNILSRGTF